MAPSVTSNMTTTDPHATEHSAPKKSSNLLDNTASKLSSLDRAELRLADTYSSPDVYVSGEQDTLWHPWVNNLEIKPLRLETRLGTFILVLRAKEDTWLGKH